MELRRALFKEGAHAFLSILRVEAFDHRRQAHRLRLLRAQMRGAADGLLNRPERQRRARKNIREPAENGIVQLLARERPASESLRLVIDSPDGVDLALCERVTGMLRDLLESYSLEVSSPGPKYRRTEPTSETSEE